MSQNLLSVAKHYITVNDFKSSDFNLKNSNLYDFSDALARKTGYPYTFTNNSANDPQPPTSKYINCGDLAEYPLNLSDIFTNYNGKAIYYPLSSNLYGYTSIPSSDRDTLLKSRISYSQNLPNDIDMSEYPSFYDGMSSYCNDNCYHIPSFYSNSSLTTKITTTNYLIETPYFLCDSVVLSKTSALTFYFNSGSFMTKSGKYCLSFFARKVSTTKVEDTLTVSASIGGKTVSGIYYSDSYGYNKTNQKISDMWERVYYIFDGSSGTATFTVTIPSTTKVGGFLLEFDNQGSFYNEILVNENKLIDNKKITVYHPIAIKLQSGANSVVEALNNDWTISFTKVGGQNISKERIGNLIFTESLGSYSKIDSDDKQGSITLTFSDNSSVTKTFTRPNNVTSNFSTRRYTLVYTKSKNQLDIYITFNLDTKLIASITDSRVTSSMTSIISESFTLNGSNYSWQYHIVLGGSTPRLLCPATRYRDLVFIRGAITFAEVQALESKYMGVSHGTRHFECDVSVLGGGEIKSNVVKEDISKDTTYLISPMIINKEI